MTGRLPVAGRLLRAPVLVVVAADPDRYVARYGRPTKAPGTRRGRGAWTVPFCCRRAGMAVMAMLLRHRSRTRRAVLRHLRARSGGGVGPRRAGDRELVGTVALGHPDPNLGGDRRPRPFRLGPVPDETDQIHHGTW
ncbi:MAG: hypothetical protein R2699_13960 [Acidimicrobiales bacterium]